MASLNSSQILVLLAIGALVVLMYVYRTSESNTQHYTAPRNYDYVDDTYLANVPPTKGNPDFDQDVNSVDFANLLGTVDYTASNSHTNDAATRFQKLHDSTKLPSNTSYLTNYDTDVANPAFYAYSARNPRVVLKDRLYAYADPYRGDIPIRRHDDVCLIEKSRHGRSSMRTSALFNPKFDEMLSNYVHGAEAANVPYKNMPINVAREGTVMDA